MIDRGLLLVELLFLLTLWWQTRFNLREVWPDFFTTPLNSDYLIPFIYLSDGLLVVMLVLWVAQKVRLGRLRVLWTELHHVPGQAILINPWTWLGLFAAVAAISLWVNQSGWWGWYGWLRLLEGVGLSIYVADRLKSATTIWRYAVLLVAGLAGEAVLLLAEWIKQGSVGLQWLGEWRFNVYTPGVAKVLFEGKEYLRPHATFAHPNVAGGVLALGLVGLWWWFFTIRKPGSRPMWHIDQLILAFKSGVWSKAHSLLESWAKDAWLVGMVLVLFSIGILFTFSRSAWLAAAFGVLVVWLLHWEKIRRIRFSRLWLGLVVVIAAGLVFAGPLIYSRFADLDSVDALSVERRIQLTEVAGSLIDENPWLGVGVNNFVPELAQYGPLYGIGIWREPVHNIFLLIAAEAGLIGLGLWLGALSLLLWQLLTSFKLVRTPVLLLLLTLWQLVLLLGMVDHYWWTSQQGRLVLWLLVGWSIAEAKRRNSGKEQRRKSKV